MGTQKIRDAGYWGLIISLVLCLMTISTLWKLRMNMNFHFSYLPQLCVSLSNTVVYSQPFVFSPRCRLCFCLRFISFFLSWISWEPSRACTGIFMHCQSMLSTYAVLLSLDFVFSSGAFTRAYFYSCYGDLNLRDPGYLPCPGQTDKVHCCCSHL